MPGRRGAHCPNDVLRGDVLEEASVPTPEGDAQLEGLIGAEVGQVGLTR